MDASKALELLQVRALKNTGIFFRHEANTTFKVLYENYQSLPSQQITVNPLRIRHHLKTMHDSLQVNEKVLPVNEKVLPVNEKVEETYPWNVFNLKKMNLSELQEIVHCISKYRVEPSKTELEKQIYDLNVLLLVETLTLMCLEQDGNDLGNMRSLFLEMAVNSNVEVRQFAFSVLFNVSVRIHTLNPKENGAKLSLDLTTFENRFLIQNVLFGLLIEMLEKVVSIEKLGRSKEKNNVLEIAMHCLFYFLQCGDKILIDRLIGMDPHIILALLQYVDSDGDSSVESRLVELQVLMMYLQTVWNKVDKTTPYWTESGNPSDPKIETTRMPSLGKQLTSAAFKKIRASVSALHLQLKFPTTSSNQNPRPIFLLDLETLQHFGGIETLLRRFHHTKSLCAQRCLFMVLFDVACSQTPDISNDDADKLYEFYSSLDLAYSISTHPFLCFKNTIPRFFNKIWTICTKSNSKLIEEVDKVKAIAVMDQLRQLMQVEEYYLQSSTLKNLMANLMQKNRENNNIISSDVIMDKINCWLESNQVEERARGERALAELLTFGASSGGNNSNNFTLETILTNQHTSTSNDSSDLLEETMIVDDVEEVLTLAKGVFWEFGKSSSVPIRIRFIRILHIFTKRMLQPLGERKPHQLMKELDTCMTILLDQDESAISVLVQAFFLVFQLASRPFNYLHGKWLDKDVEGLADRESCFHPLGSSNTLLSLYLSGGCAIDKSLLREINPRFFTHVLEKLALTSSSSSSPVSGGYISGSMEKLTNDTLACCACIVAGLCQEKSTFTQVGGMPFFLPFLQVCDTRVSLFISELILHQFKNENVDQYYTALCEILVTAQAEGKETTLDNPFLRCTTILAKGWQQETPP